MKERKKGESIKEWLLRVSDKDETWIKKANTRNGIEFNKKLENILKKSIKDYEKKHPILSKWIALKVKIRLCLISLK